MTGPLTGYTVAVTAQRRGEELAALLGRRGAKTVLAPVLRMVSLPDDQALRAATVELINDPPDVTIATTGIGFRGWLAAAEGWGLGEALHAALGSGRVWCRGPKALGAVRAAGLREEWSAPSECGWEVSERLRGEPLSGQRVAVQLHGDPSDDFTDTIRSGGGHAVPIPVYRWMLPTDITPVRRLVDQVCLRRIDAVTFTSAPAVNALLRIAGDQRTELLAALRAPADDGGVMAAVVGPVTAAPLTRDEVPVVMPERARLGSLARLVTAELPGRASRLTLASGHTVELRGHLVMVDGQVQPLPPAPMAILRALSAAKGRVLTRTELLRCLPRGCDRHAVEMAVTRLRDGLGLRSCVQTVIKRGYRLNLL
ncbi:uroporphyrinogen-III synthase [Stackebrandtia nassauensis]|uniref:Uroporphyrinogen III synthase HEM4 n=1 Tax=Stackebrandtia nassauensis (strain DSM 44728 / CIP 108903 / NRRL B-16338 / NBRC 102104 / LLR-40K-21) TaxID=446470 RepID=D3Q7C5_STANL|nr:uroporphyrinogen-III synthase [Stackebrandtia nassauensis]ADD42396.1 Uroporphyrinogen III synthase HEM4 [Stackebrandtia nassauensis DSM 44728]